MPVSPYTEERLEEAVKGVRSLAEALERLGVDPSSPTRRHLRERMRRPGVDASHFERGTKWTRDVLQSAVAASTNMCDVLRRLGLGVVGGHHTHISRRVRAYGIDISRFRAPERRGVPRRSGAPEHVLVRQPADRARRAERPAQVRHGGTGGARAARPVRHGTGPAGQPSALGGRSRRRRLERRPAREPAAAVSQPPRRHRHLVPRRPAARRWPASPSRQGIRASRVERGQAPVRQGLSGDL